MDKVIRGFLGYISGSNSKKIIFICIIPIVISYINSLGVFFIWDDYALVVENKDVRALNFKNIFKPIYEDDSPDMFKNPAYFRPLQILSYALDFRLWRLNAFGYHITNIALHIINSLLIYFIFLFLLKDKIFALLGSASFGGNPIFTSSVTYISGRADLLLSVFALLMIITFVKSIKDGEFNLLYYVISLLSYSLVLLSKEIGIISIIFLLLLDKLILKHSNSKIRKLIYLPYILLLLLWQYLKPSAALGYQFTFSSFLNLPFGPLTLLKGMAVYTAICLFPLNLHMGRSITIIAGFFDPWFYISILFTIIIISLFIFGMQRNKLLIFGLAWFYLPLFIQLVFNFLFARIGKEILLPENNLYFCYPGLLFAIFSTLQFSSFKEKIKKYLFPVFLCLLLFYITLTILENFNWQDEIKFYEKNIKYNQKSAFNYINYANLGFAYERAKEFKLAEENFKLSAEKSGGNPYFYNLLALFYIRNVGFDKALETLMISKKLDAKFYRTYLLLGIVYKSKGQAQEAKRNFEQAFSLRPQDPTARKYLGPLKDNE